MLMEPVAEVVFGPESPGFVDAVHAECRPVAGEYGPQVLAFAGPFGRFVHVRGGGGGEGFGVVAAGVRTDRTGWSVRPHGTVGERDRQIGLDAGRAGAQRGEEGVPGVLGRLGTGVQGDVHGSGGPPAPVPDRYGQ